MSFLKFASDESRLGRGGGIFPKLFRLGIPSLSFASLIESDLRIISEGGGGKSRSISTGFPGVSAGAICALPVDFDLGLTGTGGGGGASSLFT